MRYKVAAIGCSDAKARSLMRAFGAMAIAIALAFPAPAWADVRRADVIGDSTVESLGLTVAECPSIDAERAVLMDADGNVYFQRNAQDSANIASITKVMTAIVACENVEPGTTVTVSANAAAIGESTAGLQEGDSMDFDAALKALLVPSGNDAAVALAETVGAQMIAKDPNAGSDAVGAFVNAMNAKAAEIGCQNTVYENPHGLDYGEYAGNLHSDAADQALVGRYAMGIDEIRSIVGGGSTTITVQRAGSPTQIELQTTDELLEMYQYAIGIKTGLTESAGYCFSGAASNDGLELYAVVLGSPTDQGRFSDAQALFEWGFGHIEDYPLANSEKRTQMTVNGSSESVPVVADAPLSDWTDRTVPTTLADPDATVRVFAFDGNVSQEVSFDEVSGEVKAGQKLGTISFLQHNRVIAQQDLVACENSPAPGPLDALATWWTRLTAGITGAQTEAQPTVYNTMTLLNDKASKAA